MNIYYQWFPGAYSHLASKNILSFLKWKEENIDISWCIDFFEVWKKIWKENIGVLPVENSYAGSVHTNFFNFLKYDYKIIGEYYLDIDHHLLSTEKNLSDIHTVYSHPQALDQCHKFLQQHDIRPLPKWDTAGSAKNISETLEPWIAAIASGLAGEIYGLNTVASSIQDQQWNKTRFFIVVDKGSRMSFWKKTGKVSLIFEAKNIPSSLYKCLGAFATTGVNLTKIESMPSYKESFQTIFWLDFEWCLADESVKKALDELAFFTSSIKILWEY